MYVSLGLVGKEHPLFSLVNNIICIPRQQQSKFTFEMLTICKQHWSIFVTVKNTWGFLKNGCETWDACFVCVSWDEAAGMSERRQTIWHDRKIPLFSPEARNTFALAGHAGDDVTVDDHHALGPPGWAAGVHHHGQVRRLRLHHRHNYWKTVS